MTKDKNLKEWEKATDKLARHFIGKYFANTQVAIYWIGNYIGHIFNISTSTDDFYFSIDDIIVLLRDNYSKKDMLVYHSDKLKEKYNKDRYISLMI